jgi:hypothetical protein
MGSGVAKLGDMTEKRSRAGRDVKSEHWQLAMDGLRRLLYATDPFWSQQPTKRLETIIADSMAQRRNHKRAW